MAERKKTYLTKAVRRYKSLFTFPEYWTLIMLLSLVNILGSITAFIMVFPSLEEAYRGFIFGLQVLTIPTLIMDLISAKSITKKDTIFNLKRSAALSLVLCGIWVITLNVGGFLQRTLNVPTLLSYASIFGSCIAISLRFLVFISVTQLEPWKTALSTILQPSLCLLSAIAFWNLWNIQILTITIASSTILLIATYIFTRLVNKKGELAVGIGAIPLFKGFLANWLEDFTYPLEGYFEKLGSNADVSISLLAFGSKESLKALMIVPNIHPGPFRNLGSSALPYSIQKTLEEKFNVITMVPHGTSGHELDLTSQLQCEKVLREILSLADFFKFTPKATKFVRAEVGLGKATCQFFGDVALVTITCAPMSMEDVPREIGLDIIREGKELGAEEMVIIDAHNSIGSAKEVPALSEEELRLLRLAAQKAIAASLKEPKEPFEIGVAKVVPEELSIAQGVGSGGITALVVVVGGQKIAYVTIDGNNMISGLREEIITALRDLVDDCEVFTTDTHVVNAVTSIERGYHPVGEVINHESFISYIRCVVVQALANIQRSEISYRFGEVHNVKVIGEEKLVNLSMLVDSTFKFTMQVAPIIFIPALMAAILPFLLIPM